MLSIGFLFEDEKDDIDLEQHFEDRTNYHISLVNKYLDKIISLKDSRIDLAVLKQEKESHDESKFEETEYEPYVKITWNYYLKDHGKKANFSQNELKEMQLATFHHVKTNKHHPEAWDENVTIKSINQDNRDRPSGNIVNATKMPLSYIACMVADWCAVSEERSTTNPVEWENANINKRWKFTQEQVDFIYELLNKIYN